MHAKLDLVFRRISITLQWRHIERGGVSNHQRLHCLLINHLFGCRSKLRATGLCARNSPVTGEFLPQKASNAEFFSIWWHHHDLCHLNDANIPDIWKISAWQSLKWYTLLFPYMEAKRTHAIFWRWYIMSHIYIACVRVVYFDILYSCFTAHFFSMTCLQ